MGNPATLASKWAKLAESRGWVTFDGWVLAERCGVRTKHKAYRITELGRSEIDMPPAKRKETQ